MFDRLQQNPEYRALRAIDKTINDIIAIAEMPVARPAGPSQQPVRRDMDEPNSVTDIGFQPPRATTHKPNAAPLFPAHRVA